MRFREGHLATRRSDFYAATAGVLLAVIVAIAGYLIVSDIQRQQAGELRDATERLGTSIGRSVAQSVQLALGYGIPFDELYGVPDYLAEVLRGNPELASIAIESADGKQHFRLESPPDPIDEPFLEPIEVTVWITHEYKRVGYVIIGLSGENTWGVFLHQYLLLLAAVLAGGLGLAACLRIYLAESWEIPRARLMASLGANARGVFADFTRLAPTSPIIRVSYLAERARASVRSRAREVTYLAEELRSIDIDGSVTRKVDQAMGEVTGRFGFDRPTRLELDPWWPGWLALPLLMAGTMTIPLVGGFAADRVGFNLLANSAGATALALEGLGGLLGLLAARFLLLRGALRSLLHLVTLLAAAAATAWTFDLRDLTPFLATRPIAAFAIWFTLFSAMQAPGRIARTPWYCGFLLLAGMVFGPLLGSLLADGIGRRAAFLTSGVLILLAGLPLCFFTHPAQRLAQGLAGLWRQGLTVGSTIAAAAGIIAFYGGAVVDRHDYALLASFLGFLGSGFGLGLLSHRRRLAPWCLLLAVAALWLPYPINVLLCPALFFLGLALGLQVSQGWRRATGLHGLAAALLGLGLGPLFALAAIGLGLAAPIWISALLAVPLLISLIAGRPRSPVGRGLGAG